MVATLESIPTNATHWSRASMAQRSGLSKTTIGRIWKAFELKPHRVDGGSACAWLRVDGRVSSAAIAVREGLETNRDDASC